MRRRHSIKVAADVVNIPGTVRLSKREHFRIVDSGFVFPRSPPVRYELHNRPKFHFEVHGNILSSTIRLTSDALRLGESPEAQLQHETQERVTGLILANARKEFDRYAGLVRLGDVSREVYERAETNFRVAQEEHNAGLAAARKGKNDS